MKKILIALTILIVFWFSNSNYSQINKDIFIGRTENWEVSIIQTLKRTNYIDNKGTSIPSNTINKELSIRFIGPVSEIPKMIEYSLKKDTSTDEPIYGRVTLDNGTFTTNFKAFSKIDKENELILDLIWGKGKETIRLLHNNIH